MHPLKLRLGTTTNSKYFIRRIPEHKRCTHKIACRAFLDPFLWMIRTWTSNQETNVSLSRWWHLGFSSLPFVCMRVLAGQLLLVRNHQSCEDALCNIDNESPSSVLFPGIRQLRESSCTMAFRSEYPLKIARIASNFLITFAIKYGGSLHPRSANVNLPFSAVSTPIKA